MEQKKETRAQIERKLKNAIVFVPKDKETISIYFSDRGLRLTATIDSVVIETNFHRHVFNSYTQGGMSRPYLYTKRIIEIAYENDCKTDAGYSYAKLIEILKEQDDRTEYNLAVYFDWWLMNIFSPLYEIDESEVGSFLVYENYIHNIAKNSILLSEKTEAMTNKQFLDKIIENVKEFTKDIDERVLFEKKSDDDVMRENIKALQEQENEEILKDRTNGEQ